MCVRNILYRSLEGAERDGVPASHRHNQLHGTPLFPFLPPHPILPGIFSQGGSPQRQFTLKSHAALLPGEQCLYALVNDNTFTYTSIELSGIRTFGKGEEDAASCPWVVMSRTRSHSNGDMDFPQITTSSSANHCLVSSSVKQEK